MSEKALLEAFKKYPYKIFELRDIAEEVGDTSTNISGAIQSLMDKGQILKAARGKYIYVGNLSHLVHQINLSRTNIEIFQERIKNLELHKKLIDRFLPNIQSKIDFFERAIELNEEMIDHYIQEIDSRLKMGVPKDY